MPSKAVLEKWQSETQLWIAAGSSALIASGLFFGKGIADNVWVGYLALAALATLASATCLGCNCCARQHLSVEIASGRFSPPPKKKASTQSSAESNSCS